MKKRIVFILLAAFLLSLVRFSASAEPGSQNPPAAAAPSAAAVATPGDTPATPAPPWADNPIRIVAPAEKSHLPALGATFVCGSVPPGSKLSLNGAPVTVHPDGGFVTMVRLAPGEFQIDAELQSEEASYRLTRTVFVAKAEQAAPVSPLTIETVTPSRDQELLPGDEVIVTCKGSPGMKASFTIKGVKKRRFPMFETGAAPGGIYQGVYRVGNKDRLRKSKIKVTLAAPDQGKTVKESDATLSRFPDKVPFMIETVSPDAVLRTGPALTPDDKAGYLMFPPPGTVLQATGRNGDEYRVRLTQTQNVWVSVNHVKQLPEGTPPSHGVVGSVSVSADGYSTLIRIPLGRKIPFKIDPDVAGNSIDISLYGAFSNTDLIANPAKGVLKDLRWFQDNDETYRLRAYPVSNGWWGYDARFEGNTLVFELRSPSSLVAGDSPLAGLVIAVDAGHGAGGGAMGTTGYAEGDANMAMALNLKEKLLAKGAQVIFTRTDGTDVPLSDRPRIAWQQRADLLVSLHNNSLGAGGNPLQKHGYGVYYFTPMSLGLTKEVHTAYGAAFGAGSAFPMPDDGLYYDNLAMTRAPQMPSILIESAYMILPQEEAYLKNDAFRSACSEAIIRGMEAYARSMRPAAPQK